MEDSLTQLNGKDQTTRVSLFTQQVEQFKYNTNQSINQSNHQSKLNNFPSFELIKNVAYTTSHDEDSCCESIDRAIESVDQSVDSSLSASNSPVTSKLELNNQINQSINQSVNPPVNRPRVPLGQIVAELNREWSMEALQSAENGDVESMCLVGQMYAEGWGAINQSVNQSKYWLNCAKQHGLGQHVETIEKHCHSLTQSSQPSDKHAMDLMINDSSTDSSGGSSTDRVHPSSHHHSYDDSSINQSINQSVNQPMNSPSRYVPSSTVAQNSQPSFFSTLINAISPALKVKQAAKIQQSSAQPVNQSINQSINQSNAQRAVGRSVSYDHLVQPSRVLRPNVNQSISQSASRQSVPYLSRQANSDDDHHVISRHRVPHTGRAPYHQLFVTAS